MNETVKNLSYSHLDNNKINLSWDDVEGAYGYNIYRIEEPFTHFILIAKVRNNSYVDEIDKQKDHTYLLSAFDESHGPLSEPLFVSSTSSSIAGPTSLTLSLNNNNEVVLTYSPITNASEYLIERSLDENGPYTNIGTSQTTSYTDKSTSSNTRYYYRVYASTPSGNSEYSPVESILTSSTNNDDQNTLTLTASTSNNNAVLSWNTVEGATSYNIYLQGVNPSLISSTTNNTYNLTSLTPGYTYQYFVRALGSDNTVLATSNTVNVTPSDDTSNNDNNITIRLSTGINCSVLISYNQIPQASSYNIYRSSSASGPFTLIGSTTSNVYVDQSTSTNNTYYYQVRPIINNQIGTVSNTASITTTDCNQYQSIRIIFCNGAFYRQEYLCTPCSRLN